jgi:hypothetical protein
MFETAPSEAERGNPIRSFDVTHLRLAKKGIKDRKKKVMVARETCHVLAIIGCEYCRNCSRC